MVRTMTTVGLVLCVPFCQRVTSETRYVDHSVPVSGDGRSWETAFQTIQEGIEASSDGDTVMVAQGIYVEDIEFNGKNITLRGTNPFDPTVIANTVIDGNQAGTVVSFEGTEDASCVLAGLTIRNGKAEFGGGLHSCQGTIRICIIRENTPANAPQLYDCGDPAYCCIEGWAGGEGYIDADPLFADADGPDGAPGTYEDNDYRLTSGSPCIDAGTNSALTSPGFDLDGNLRIARWRSLIAIVDMGAYEYNARPFVVREILFVSGGRRVVWNSQPRDTYSVAMRYSFQGADWHAIGTISSQGESTSFTDTGFLPWGWRTLFYRIEMQ